MSQAAGGTPRRKRARGKKIDHFRLRESMQTDAAGRI
jgi:hypothetical protein